LTRKRHDHVIRDIRAMLDALKDAPDLGHVREDKDARGYTAMLHLDRELTGIFAASLGVQPEVRANRPVRPVVLLRSPAVN
jgi:hypothetical protein